MDEVMTVDVAMGRLERLEGYGLAVHPERCVRVRNRHASCVRCAEACTSGALSLRDGALTVNEALCVGCGTCATVCPTCAIEARHPVDGELLAAAHRALRAGSKAVQDKDASRRADGEAGGGQVCEAAAAGKGHEVVFACHRALEQAPAACAEAGAIELACLSRMEESLAMRLFADGAQRIRLLHGACEGCPRENGFVSVQLVRDTVDSLLKTWFLTCEYDVRQVGSEAKADTGVSGGSPTNCPEIPTASSSSTACDEAPAALATSAARGNVSAEQPATGPAGRHAAGTAEPAARATGGVRTASALRKPAHVQADGTLPHFVPLRRHALLDALADLGSPARPDLDTRLWGHVSIDMSACRSCKMCAVFCPTGALQKYVGEDGHGGVEHYPAECVHCGLCQDICPVQAITSSTAVPTSMLADGKTERYPMPDPAWTTGPDQILRKMTPQIHSREVQHSY